MNRTDYFARWSELHGGANIGGAVKGWLSISYLISRPLVRLRVSPGAISLLGVIAAVFTFTQGRERYAIAVLGLSLLCDGIDGTVAILTGKEGKRGAMVDAISDRISETFWALTLYKLGAPVWIVGFAWLFAFTQEYARARIAGLGDYRIDIVTISERPVRAALLAVAFVAFNLHISAVTAVTTLWATLQGISLVMVMLSGYRRLSASDRLGD